jgi:hypothetical protein
MVSIVKTLCRCDKPLWKRSFQTECGNMQKKRGAGGEPVPRKALDCVLLTYSMPAAELKSRGKIAENVLTAESAEDTAGVEGNTWKRGQPPKQTPQSKSA